MKPNGSRVRLATVGTLVLVMVNAAIVRRDRSSSAGLMLLGAVALACSAIGWAQGRPAFRLAPAWMTFFVATISAERLDLARTGRPIIRRAHALLVAAATLAVGSSIAAVWLGGAAQRLSGAALVGVAVWLLAFDSARRAIGQRGLPRYVAAAVLSGAVWLAFAGLQLSVAGLPPGGPQYDAALHAVFIGFVLSMVMAHAPLVCEPAYRLIYRSTGSSTGRWRFSTLRWRCELSPIGSASIRRGGSQRWEMLQHWRCSP